MIRSIIERVKSYRHFLAFIFLFAYIHSIQGRLILNQEINNLVFTPEAAIFTLFKACILFVIMDFILKKGLKSDYFDFSTLLKGFILSVFVYFILMQLISILIALIFNNFERNFNQRTLINTSLMYVTEALIYGSFYLSYFYYRQSRSNQEKISEYNQVIAENKITQLKNQINPHFLFNNLNILDQLIEEDKAKASDFLNNFSELYRFVLQASDRNIIPIAEEIDFIKKYFSLIKQKFGKVYQLELNIKNTNGCIVPLSLQLLVENAIKHNIGSEVNPIRIVIIIESDIVVKNNINLKPKNSLTSGKGLNNLKIQYNLLSNQTIEINQNEEEFSVKIPIIQAQDYDKNINNRR